MEGICKNCSKKAEYICVCKERKLCDKCLLDHVSRAGDMSHRPVSLVHPLLTLIMESESASEIVPDNAVKDQIFKLSKFKEKSIKMIDNKIKQLLELNEKNSMKKSLEKSFVHNSPLKLSLPVSRESPVAESVSHLDNLSQPLRIEDLSHDMDFREAELSMWAREPLSKLKIVVMGESGVGKTTLLTTFKSSHTNLKYSSNNKAAGKICIENKTFNIDLWDLSGKNKYAEIYRICLHGAVGAIFLFDLVNEISLWNIEKKINEFSREADVLSVVALVGNKLDLALKYPKKRYISYEEGYKLASSKGMIYDEISTLNTDHISSLFKTIVKEIYRRKIQKTNGKY